MPMQVSCHANVGLVSHFLLLTPVIPSKISPPMRLPPACPQHAQHAWGHELGRRRHAIACLSQFILLFQILIFSLDFGVCIRTSLVPLLRSPAPNIQTYIPNKCYSKFIALIHKTYQVRVEYSRRYAN